MAKKMWGGRFDKKTDPLVEDFTKSIDYDYKLAEYDVLGTMIHVEVLEKSGFITSGEADKLVKGLVFGLCAWAVGTLHGMLSTYAFMTVATGVVIYWTVLGLVEIPLRGLIIASIYGE